MGRLARTLGAPSVENYGGSIDQEQAQAAQIELDTRTALEEMDEVEAQLNEVEPEGEMLTEAMTETYPEVIEILEEAQENGGISVESARLLNILNRVHGIEDAMSVSVESFSDSGRSAQSTRVAVEGLKATIKNWWQKLKAWFKKMRAKLKTWWEKTWAAAPRLKSNAQSIRERAQKTTSVAKEKKIEVVAANKVLGLDGKFPGAQGLATALNTAADTAGKLFETVQPKSIEVADNILKAIEAAKFSDEASLSSLGDNLVKAAADLNPDTQLFSKDVPDAKATGFGEIGEGLTLRRTEQMPGNQAIFVCFAPAGAGATGAADKIKGAADALARRKTTVTGVLAKDVDDSSVSVDTATTQQIISICDAVIKMADIIEGYKRKFAKSEEAHKNLDQAGDHVEREANDGDAKEGMSAILSDIRRIIPAARLLIDEPSAKLSGVFMSVGKNTLNYCNRSLSAY
ncbi:hypothetical protein [Erwinia phage vB_Ea277G]|jgi:hypothetical protein|nr:hypothetical protein [Erwinia phage vB_Ea277G]